MSSPSPINVLDHPAALREGSLSLELYLDALEANFGRREPGVQAFLPEPGRFDRLRREAATLANRYPDPGQRPSLFGYPLAVKDIFHADGFSTLAGSRLPEGTFTGEEADSVRLLRAAGCLIMGKTVTTEFAYFPPGPTTNPHNPAHTPGGSSSGSAAAVAAGMSPLALGTQTIGSIIRPAAFCGVAGYKPSYDRISRGGVIPLAPSLDHVGFFAPDVNGLESAAAVLCAGWRPPADPVRPVLGVPDGPYLGHTEPAALEYFEEICRRLQAARYDVRRVPVLDDFEDVQQRHNLILEAEAAGVHRHWYAEFRDLYHPTNAALIESGQGRSEKQLARALAGQRELRRGLLDLMQTRGIDLWISPSAPGPAPAGLESTGNPVMNLPWTQAGLPVLNLPSGLTPDGLPLGLQVTGAWWADEALLAWGAQLEAVVGGK
jgi:Asp-tRNA(Asn)/Glu-tRNA(Gln) amidotransferase A subunit family amidase